MTSGIIREGEASVKKELPPSTFVEIIQGAACFFGMYKESPNGVFLVAFSDSSGQVCLVKNMKTILWTKKLERPNDGDISDSGRVVINDWLKIKQKLGGKFYFFDHQGKILVVKEFDSSNLEACAISKEGNYAVASTLFPDNTIYFFSDKSSDSLWKNRNHSREPVLGLLISDGKVQVWTGKSVATKRYDYSLTFEGSLSKEDVVKVRQVESISKGKIEDSITMLTEALTSTDEIEYGKV